MQRYSFVNKFSFKRAINVLLTGAVCAGLLSGCAAMPAAPSAAPAASEAYAEAATESAAAAPAAAAPAAGGSYSPVAEPPPADMFYEDYGTQGFVRTSVDNLSTFAVDVDTGAYTVARGYLAEELHARTRLGARGGVRQLL